MTPLACALVGLRKAKDAREDIIAKKAENLIALAISAQRMPSVDVTQSSAPVNTGSPPQSPTPFEGESKESMVELMNKSASEEPLLENKAKDRTHILPLTRPESVVILREKSSDSEVS